MQQAITFTKSRIGGSVFFANLEKFRHDLYVFFEGLPLQAAAKPELKLMELESLTCYDVDCESAVFNIVQNETEETTYPRPLLCF